MQKRAVVLLSGGLDSATALAVAQHEERDVYAITFQYGQRHMVEIEAARRVVRSRGVHEHLVVTLDPRLFGGSSLTAGGGEIPKARSAEEIGHGVPTTYVPARNTVFLAHALAWAEVIGAAEIFLGVNALDYSGYPDCRPAFVAAFERMARLATKAGVEGEGICIRAPLIAMTKAEIIREGLALGVDYSVTSSCYDPSPEAVACGQCDSCQLRLKGFAEAGVSDLIRYA